jgi:hypothetical protein
MTFELTINETQEMSQKPITKNFHRQAMGHKKTMSMNIDKSFQLMLSIDFYFIFTRAIQKYYE